MAKKHIEYWANRWRLSKGSERLAHCGNVNFSLVNRDPTPLTSQQVLFETE